MLKTLRRIIQEVNTASDFDSVLDIIVHRAREVLDADASSIFLVDRRRGEYVLMATDGLNEDSVGSVRIGFTQGLVGLVGEREEPVNVDEASKHTRYLDLGDEEDERFPAFLGVPIIYHRQVLGVLAVHQQEPRRYDEAEEAFLVTLSTQIAGVISHAEASGKVSRMLDTQTTEEASYSGIPSAPGVGLGECYVVYPPADLSVIPDRSPEDADVELAKFEAAIKKAQEDIRVLGERLTPNLPPEEQALFEVYERMLDSPSLGAEVAEEICAGNWAQGALRKVIHRHIQQFETMENEYLRERAADIRDLGQRVLAHLQDDDQSQREYPDKVILVGEEVTATNLAEVPKEQLAGVVCMTGSSSSHVAILARALGVPTVMGVAELDASDLQGEFLIVDGYYGQVFISPAALLKQEYQRLFDEEEELAEDLEKLNHCDAETKDNQRIQLLVNTGLGADIGMALSVGAEGVGLYRTEIPFMIRDCFPSSEEQRVIYRQLLGAFAPRPVTMRTLDVGGDKPLPYFPVEEENPFLGWRGVRITLDQPEIFLVQVRAMLRASEGYNNLSIMLPMVSDVNEIDEAIRLLKKAHADVQDEGLVIDWPKIGVMVEVPSAVYQAELFAQRVDFLSVGSNDLTQYLLAVDRNNPRVANLYDSLHPAVLHALKHIVEGAHRVGKPVSLCGEMASDPVAGMLLFALGFDSLSMNATSLSRIKWVLRQFTSQQAKKFLQDCLAMESAVMVRCYMEYALEEAGLGGLIRAGRK